MLEALSFIPLLAGAARAVAGRGAAKKATVHEEKQFLHKAEERAAQEFEDRLRERTMNALEKQARNTLSTYPV